MKTYKKVSIVIVTYNRLELLKECIICAQNQTVTPHEIIIVNNCSTDGTKEFLSKLENTEGINILNLPKNIGGAGGFSEGMKNVSSKADYALVIDDDAMLGETYIEKLLDGEEPGVEAYSGSVMTNGKIIRGHRYQVKNEVILNVTNASEDEYNHSCFYCDLASFCGLMVSRNLMEKIGFPIADYFIWQDDIEYSFRIKKYSKIKNINAAILNHKTEDADNPELNWKHFYGFRNFIDLGRKHSKCPWIFELYCVWLHISRMVGSLVICYIFRNKKEHYKRKYRLHKDALQWMKNGTLGIDERFYPGMKW